VIQNYLKIKDLEEPKDNYMKKNMDSIRYFLTEKDERLNQLRNMANYRSVAQTKNKKEL